MEERQDAGVRIRRADEQAHLERHVVSALRITNVYREQKEQGVYKFCEKPAGKWKLVGPDKE